MIGSKEELTGSSARAATAAAMNHHSDQNERASRDPGNFNIATKTENPNEHNGSARSARRHLRNSALSKHQASLSSAFDTFANFAAAVSQQEANAEPTNIVQLIDAYEKANSKSQKQKQMKHPKHDQKQP